MSLSPAPLKNGSFTRTYGAPSSGGVWPRFFLDTVQDMVATERSGRPIYYEVERVELNTPGNPYSKPVKEVTEEIRQRWPEEYARFKAGNETAVSGTPVEQLPFLKKNQVLELKALGFMTVEHLAGMTEHAIQKTPMGRRLKELAEAYLDDAKAMALVTKAQAESDSKDKRIAELELRLETLNSQMTGMFDELQKTRNAPNPLMTHVPAASDPVELARFGRPAGAPAQSSFADLPAPRRRRQRREQMETTVEPAGSEGGGHGEEGSSGI